MDNYIPIVEDSGLLMVKRAGRDAELTCEELKGVVRRHHRANHIFALVCPLALEQDFNLRSRIREEVGRLGQRDGVAAAVVMIGGVVSPMGW